MIDLPSYPSPNGAEIGLVGFGALLTPSLGGPSQRVNRLGSRFRIAVTMPPMKVGDARKWIARLIRAQDEGARMALPLLGFQPGLPGAVRVNGAGQAGSTLVVDGVTPNYAFREGQYFSILTGDKHHLYLVTGEAIANAAGQATLPIAPMLRRPHADNDEVHVGKPMIEGFVGSDDFSYALSIGNFAALHFDLVESQ